MSEVVIYVQDLNKCTDRARCRHCSFRLLYSKASSNGFENSRFICIAHARKFINPRSFACSDFKPKYGYSVYQSNVQLNLQFYEK